MVQDLQEAVPLACWSWRMTQFNLGLALLSQGSQEENRPLVAWSEPQAMAPEVLAPNNALCCIHALRSEPERALPFCDQAVAFDLLRRAATTDPRRRPASAVMQGSHRRVPQFFNWLRTRPQVRDLFAMPPNERRGIDFLPTASATPFMLKPWRRCAANRYRVFESVPPRSANYLICIELPRGN